VELVILNAHPDNSAPIANASSIAQPDKPPVLAPVSIPKAIPITAAPVVSNAPVVSSAPMALVLAHPV
jgi:hypothetical protein